MKFLKQSHFSTSRRVVVFTSALFLFLLIWQSFSSSLTHHNYQESLMDSVTSHIIDDYQEYFNQLRQEIDLFQLLNEHEIKQLNQAGTQASEAEYNKLYNKLKSNINHSRLFAFIDHKGKGTLRHITGDFLPACEEEVLSTITLGTQEQLFLHHSKTSVHFDLLQPLLAADNTKEYFFTAFNPDVLQKLLVKYQLPHQQLFLMRTDNIGVIELSSESENKDNTKITMSSEELKTFSYVKDIPRTRWQVAIRLEPKYSTNIFMVGLIKAIVIWLLLTAFIYTFYRIQKARQLKHAQVEEELHYKNKHDKLTGLVNREQFDHQLSTLISKKLTQKNSEYGVVIHVDIDQFKVINNSLGYAWGDKILHLLSISLKEMLPEDTVFSRLGNDEFAIILPTLYHSSAESFAEKVRLYIQKIDLNELEDKVHLTASIGVVILNGEQLDSEQVLSSLVLSTKLAKEKGRNRTQLYQSDDEQLTQHAAEMDIIHDLAKALVEERLVLYRQEIRSTSTRPHAKHYEVLVRLKNQNGEIISPNIFIPAAEKYGLIKQLDQTVIAKTLDEMSRNPDDDVTYSINLSGASMTDHDTCNYIRYSFKKYGINPKRICFEITETSAITHIGSALKFINQLRKIGCYFALDDFGSGHSSFSYLQQLPVRIIKIDGAFVRDIHTNEINRIFVENIQRTASAMHIKTVAEFVESQEIVDVLDKIGIHKLQGYHIHKPEFWT